MFVVAALVVAVPLWASMTYAVRHADVLPATREQNAKDEGWPEPERTDECFGRDRADAS